MSFDVIKYLNNLVSGQVADIEDITSAYDLPTDWRIEYEERAAILEYDGGLTRKEADVQALDEIRNRMRLWRKNSDCDYGPGGLCNE